MKKYGKLFLFLAILCVLTIASHAKATPIVFAKGSYCASYAGEIDNSKTFSLFLLKNQYLNVHYNGKEVRVKVTDKTGKLYKDKYDEYDMYVFSPIPKKGNYYVTITPKPNYHHSWQEIKFCAEHIDV